LEMKKDVAVFSVCYAGVEPYISDFLRSLSAQTDKHFTLFLLSDGFPDLGRHIDDIDFPVRVLERTGHPAALRKTGIQWVVSEGEEAIIFADSDDYFAENRIETARRMLGGWDVVCNEILLAGRGFQQPASMFGKLFGDIREISAEDITYGNCLGLSNTSMRVDKIPPFMTAIPDNTIAFDWDFFALSVHAGARVAFTKETKTYYRQHDNNIASPRSFSEEQILRGVKVKRDHYGLLSRYYDEYTDLAQVYQSLFERMQSDGPLRDNYCEAVRTHAIDASMWWQSIKTLKELGL
jgi:glycosyltransferase involved in cell wall biosynthesis